VNHQHRIRLNSKMPDISRMASLELLSKVV
jgi:hypothetical protein